MIVRIFDLRIEIVIKNGIREVIESFKTYLKTTFEKYIIGATKNVLLHKNIPTRKAVIR